MPDFMDILSKIEKEKNISLPEIYKTFYKCCSVSMPEDLIGTDLINNRSDLNQFALELLKEDGMKNFLTDKDFVFLMHQGYVFMYFRADGNPDPDVFMYSEINRVHENRGRLSEVIKMYFV